MFAIQPSGLHGAEEELGAVRVWPCVGHRQNSWTSVLQCEVLICKLHAVDGLTTSAVASSEVTALAHEVWNDTVEGGALEVQGFARSSSALLTSA
eukprot:3740814-Amphidinium_carterae.1